MEVIQLIVSEVRPLIVRDRNWHLNEDDATDLLSTWAHLQRFDPKIRPVDVFAELNSVVQSRSIKAWQDAVVSTLDPQAWREALVDLVDDRDALTGQCGRTAHLSEARRLLDDLDQADLALWAVRKLGGSSEVLEFLQDELSQCLHMFAEEIDVFKELNSYATILRKAYREDLLTFDAGLWWTVAKFDMIANYAAIVAEVSVI